MSYVRAANTPPYYFVTIAMFSADLPSPPGLLSQDAEIAHDETPNETPTQAPAGRRNGGIGAKIKRVLAPRPITLLSNLLGSVTRLRPTTARAKISVSAGQRHKPDPLAVPLPAVARRAHDGVRMATGGKAPVAPASVAAAAMRARDAGGCEAVTEPSIETAVEALISSLASTGRDPEQTAIRLFTPEDGAECSPSVAAIGRILATCFAPAGDAKSSERFVAKAQQDVVLHHMNALFGKDADAAHAALEAIIRADNVLELTGPSFKLACRLASDSFGYTTLRALSQPSPANGDRAATAIRDDAQKLALRAANAFNAVLPTDTPPIDSATRLQQAAQEVLTRAGMSRGEARDSPRSGSHAETDVTMLARAALGALQLAADPAAELTPDLQSAYAAWRFGFAAEGPRTPLARTQDRLFKLSKYARRASTPGMFASLRRMFGFNKSPMSALAMGTGGASLRHPDDDLSKTDVIAQASQVFASRVQQNAQRVPDQQTVETAVRAAALEAWRGNIETKGWRDHTRLPSRMRKAVVERSMVLCGVDRARIEGSDTFVSLKHGDSLHIGTLRRWLNEFDPRGASGARRDPRDATPEIELSQGEAGAREESWPGLADDMAARLKEGLDQLETLTHFGETPLDRSSPQTVLANFKRMLIAPRTTYDVKLADGAQFGINAGVQGVMDIAKSAPSPIFIPFFQGGPDVKLIHGRHAVVSAGSSATHGQLFVGSDRRWSAHFGASAIAGGSLLRSNLLASVGVQALPLVLDSAEPKGVMVRCRLQPLAPPPEGTLPAGVTEAWRAKMLSVVEAATESGPDGTLPSDTAAMWAAIMRKFYKDPDISLNWLESKAVTVSSALNVSGGIRYEHDGYKIGPIVQGGLSKVWNARQQRKETGPLRMQYTSSAEGSQVNVSATLAAGFKPVGHFSDDFGHVKAISLPSAGAIGVGTTVLQSETGVQWRLTEEDGEFDPALCYRDATFTSVENFKRYVDSRRAAWDKTYAAQPPGAAVPEPMDEYLARVDQDATSGNQLYAERTWMKPAAGAVLNALRAMRDIRAQAVASTGGKRVPDGRFDEDAAISKLLLDEASWDNRFLYSLEFTGESRVQGPSFLGVLQRVTEVSHPHQLSVLRAERPNENAGN